MLDGAAEAYFSALGVIAGMYRQVGLVGDIGGGSLEIAEGADNQVGSRSVRLPLGGLPAFELMRKRGQAAQNEIDAALDGRRARPGAGPGSPHPAVQAIRPASR